MVAKQRMPAARAGIPVDAAGGPTIDPTTNVIALEAASNVRQDDLRAAQNELVQTQLRLHEKIAQMREAAAKELMAAESKRIDQQLALRAAYEERLAKAESGRIDAIRTVDVNAVAVASQRAADQATVLANQVTQSAEALRTLVATTAAAVATSQQQLASTLSVRLTTLEQGSYQQAGKQSFADPAFVELLTEVKQLRETARQGTGRSEGSGTTWAVLAIVGALLLTIVGISVSLFSALHR